MGLQKNETTANNNVNPAKKAAGIFISIRLLILGLIEKKFHENNAIITIATRMATSLIRRFQKRVIVTGLIVPPTSNNNLLDIMTIMVIFYK